MAWEPGTLVVHRHLCGERPWALLPVYVVSDTEDLLVTYLPTGAPVTYLPGPWPTANGHHPWYPTPTWSGHGVLHLQRPGDQYGVWAFWDGDDRTFACWYLNIHEWTREDSGCAIRDLELDVVVYPDGSWRLKDEHLLDVRVTEGRLTAVDAATARAIADELVAMVEADRTWWDRSWSEWSPPAFWGVPPRLAVPSSTPG